MVSDELIALELSKAAIAAKPDLITFEFNDQNIFLLKRAVRVYKETLAILSDQSSGDQSDQR